ncbi:hypothetical protein P43SY_001610 [Pythium insidiosum]|uniref:HTH psq-type domain-containing protein n=1 Tax=Pythium insidiosum TaxID=114742 RepID=A0AAD5LQD9_PYTIN|nr:hypothetical protein P43SY_001610 [Pythium insidiosum]
MIATAPGPLHAADCSWRATAALPSFQTFLQTARCTTPTLPTRPQAPAVASASLERYIYGRAPRMFELALLSARHYETGCSSSLSPASPPASATDSDSPFTIARSHSSSTLSDDSEQSDEDTRPRRSKSLSPPPRTKKKYLKERQRCEIVRRVRAGERQAHLAKEFGVSRAAVCYLLKHQDEILSRSSAATTIVNL